MRSPISYNSLKESEEKNKEVKFLTLREYNLGRLEFKSKVDKLIAQLKLANITVQKCVIEYCVFDSNISIDLDWLRQNSKNVIY